MNSKIIQSEDAYFWKYFPGFTLLFENLPAQYQKGLLANDINATAEFYRKLHHSFTELSQENPVLSQRNQFLHLSPTSWHITLLDGLNAANINQSYPEIQEAFAQWLKRMNPSHFPSIWLELIEKYLRWFNALGSIQLKYRSLYKFKNSVLVVSLKPADVAALDQLHRYKIIRRQMIGEMKALFGCVTAERYLPHCSLGYFVEEENGKRFEPYLEKMNQVLEFEMKDQILELNRVALFQFENMEEFYKMTP